MLGSLYIVGRALQLRKERLLAHERQIRRESEEETVPVTFKYRKTIEKCTCIFSSTYDPKNSLTRLASGLFNSQLSGIGTLQYIYPEITITKTGEFLNGKMEGEGQKHYTFHDSEPKPNGLSKIQGTFIGDRLSVGQAFFYSGACLMVSASALNVFALQLSTGKRVMHTRVHPSTL